MEPNHTTLAGHCYEHDIVLASAYVLFHSVFYVFLVKVSSYRQFFALLCCDIKSWIAAVLELFSSVTLQTVSLYCWFKPFFRSFIIQFNIYSILLFFLIIIIIIIIILMLMFLGLHKCDRFPWYHLFKYHGLAHFRFSVSTFQLHLLRNPPKFFYRLLLSCPYMLPPSHLYLYTLHVQSTSTSHVHRIIVSSSDYLYKRCV